MCTEDNESAPRRVISYARVSTGAQAASGLGIEAQHLAVRAAAAAWGWQIVDLCTDDAVSTAIEPSRRPQLSLALARLDAGEADVLAAVRLDRFARSTRDLQLLLDLAAAGGWELVGLDLPVNPDLPVGAFMHTIIGAVNQLDRSLISDRTRAALAVARGRGQRLGRPSRQSQAAKDLAVTLRAEGVSLRKIAAALEGAGLWTVTGKITWSRSSVQGLLRTVQLDREAEANAARYAAEQRNR